MDVKLLEPYVNQLGSHYMNKSKVTYKCSECSEKTEVILKHLKEKLQNGVLFCKRCSIKNKWRDPSFRAKINASQKDIWSGSDVKAKIAAKSKLNWQNIEYRTVQDRIHSNPDYIKASVTRSQKLWESDDFRKQQAKTRNTNEWKKRQSASMKSLWDNEAYRATTLRSLASKFPTYTTLIAGTELRSFILHNVRILEIGSVKSCDGLSQSNAFLNSFHYAGYGRPAKVVYSAYLDDELIAICKFSPIIRQEVATSMGIPPKTVLELDRLCISPDRHVKNFASYFISKCIKLVFNKYRDINHLVSFADMTHNHLGTIYKASNWRYIGSTSPNYFYVNKDGLVFHKKTLYNQAVRNKMKESEYARLHGYSRSYGKEKYKYVYDR